jgi:DNA-binding NarL/FixJ family response regulator
MNTRNRARLRVLLAHSNLMTSRLLSEALEKNPEIKVLGCVPDLDSLVKELDRLQPDVMVVSTHVASVCANRLASLRTVITAYPSIPSVLLMDRSAPETVVDAFRAGVKGVFCCATGDTKQLEKCIQRVAEGQIWADTTQLHYVVSALPILKLPESRVKRAGSSLLTPREDQVMRLVAEGMTNRDIAAEMQLSENTIKNYLFKIFEKLGFSNRVELVLYATANAPLVDNEPSAAEALVRAGGSSTV